VAQRIQKRDIFSAPQISCCARSRLRRAGEIDVGLPPGFSAVGLEISGWDIKDIRFSYNYRTDELLIGVNCYGVCGDADGDGNPNSSSGALNSRGGVDLPGFRNSESVLVALDLGSPNGGLPDGVMDFIIGYPSERSADSDRFPCGDVVFDTTCFGLYLYSGEGLDRAYTRFRYSRMSGRCRQGLFSGPYCLFQ